MTLNSRNGYEFKAYLLSLSIATAGIISCTSFFEGTHSDGLYKAEQSGGPKIVYDVLADDFPEIPMPNNQATRLDPSSPTGRLLNVSEQAPTEYERRTRRKFNDLDGFGTYAPITVSFDAPLDLTDIWKRHNENDDFRDDVAFLLNVDPNCSRYGEEVAFDIGRGRFPATLYNRATVTPDTLAPKGMRQRRRSLFLRAGFDTHASANNMLFEEWNEDLNGNGILDAGEDRDYDGVLDQANFIDPKACDAVGIYGSDGQINPNFDQSSYDKCVADNLLTWYERQSNTLILRSVWPLEQRCTYAVVLTKRIKGEDGRSIDSPFASINHRDQTNALKPLKDLLPRYNLGFDDVGFAWTFTTGSMTHDLEDLRKGLYGVGKFDYLKNEFPPTSFDVWTRGQLNSDIPANDEAKQAEPGVLQGACAGAAFATYWNVKDEWPANLCAIEADMSAIGGVFGGTFQAPDLLVDSAGIATENYPSDDDESWSVDLVKGEARYGSTDVTFWCSMPIEKTTCASGNPEGVPFCKPFPTILYAHGYGGSRAEVVVGHMGRTNAMGYTMCALDAYGHGLNRLGEDTIEGALFGAQLEDAVDDFGIPELRNMMTLGRDRDLNNDGATDPGADMWTSDVFHTRDMVRQTVLETIQFVRILRSMDGRAMDDNGHLLGDVDHDGTVDIGGPKNTVGKWGISLGGIISGVAAGAEPTLNSVSPNAGGAGLVDVAVRSSQAGVPQAVVLPILGPFIDACLPTNDSNKPLPEGTTGVGCFSEREVPAGTLELAFVVRSNAREADLYLGSVPDVYPGDRIRLENGNNGEVDEVLIDAWGNARVAVPSDAIRPVERRGILEMDDETFYATEIEPELAEILGDRLTLTIYKGNSDQVRATVDSFLERVEFQGTIYPEGTPLVAVQEGLGLKRNSPNFRRFLGFAQSALGPADPAIWSARILLEPADHSYDPNWTAGMTHVLQMPTAGDKQVPVNTGIAMGRISGLFGSWLREPEKFGPEVGWREIFVPNPDYGMPVDQLLIDRFVVEGDPRFQRFPNNPGHPNVIYDIDNVSDGNALFTCGPSDWSASNGENGCPDELKGEEILFPVPHPTGAEPPLRLSIERADGSFDAFRIPLLRPAGQHGIYNPQPFRRFDADAYMVNFTTRYLGTRGGDVSHLAGCDCNASDLPNFTVNGSPIFPSFEQACSEADMRVCDASCTTGWQIETPPEANCVK